MAHNLLPVDQRTFRQVEQSGQPLVVYPCKLQGVPCGLFVEGTTSAVSAHLRGHGITPDTSSTICTWEGCSKTLKKGNMTRHVFTHFGAKVRCSVCRAVKCRRDILLAHIKSSEPCGLAAIEMVNGPEARELVPSWLAYQRLTVMNTDLGESFQNSGSYE